MTRPRRVVCPNCGALVAPEDLGSWETSARTWGGPAEYTYGCIQCAPAAGRDDEDEAYERAAERARGNDFEDTDGKDWT